MKQVVLSEGKRDVELVRCYYEQFHSDLRVDTFIAEEEPYSDLKHSESNAIENFLERRNPYDVFAKSENGKSDLKLIFIKLIRYLMKQDVQVCLLIDLDGGDQGRLIEELDERVRRNFEGTHLEIGNDDRIQRSPAQVATRHQLFENGNLLGAFELIGFHYKLETAAGIDKENDSEEVQERKLREFVNDDRASPMHRVL